MDRRFSRISRRIVVILLLTLVVPVQTLAADSAFWRSALVPGAGQAHEGNLKKAAIFAGIAVGSAVGLFATAVTYSQSADRYNDEKRIYLYYPTQLAGGQVVSSQEIDQTYKNMQAAWDEAESRYTWRNVFLATFITVYAVNLIDLLLTKPHDTETALDYNIEVDRDKVMLTRSIRF